MQVSATYDAQVANGCGFREISLKKDDRRSKETAVYHLNLSFESTSDKANVILDKIFEVPESDKEFTTIRKYRYKKINRQKETYFSKNKLFILRAIKVLVEAEVIGTTDAEEMLLRVESLKTKPPKAANIKK